MTGSISIGEELSPIQLLLKEWFFTCYAAGTMYFFCTQGIMLFAAMAIWERRKQMRRAVESPSFDLGSDVESQSGDANREEGSRHLGSDVESQGDVDDDIDEVQAEPSL